MRCQDAERLILESGGLGPEERSKLDTHLARCARCLDFREFWRALQGRVSFTAPAGAPSGLAERVRRAAHAELHSGLAGEAWWAPADARPEVPGFVWAALAAITILTLGFLIPGVQDFVENQKLTLGTGLVLVLILQNTLTLFFAPVVLRRRRYLQGG
ncbi:MAG: hypothetical protein A2W03_02620 [Candidatus Aminicenantes bacterium RBG_16_63_16]|nr:MAG: hypothetical protein A2W03_02620 [Candidatus Aminicenantes bacterium RBG_16_63_16]